MTITYEYEGALYVNLTNRCNCNCEFCLRHGKKEGSIYTEDSLWFSCSLARFATCSHCGHLFQPRLESFIARRDSCNRQGIETYKRHC